MAPTRKLGGRFVLGTTLNPVYVRADTKDGGDDDKSHPWELDTSSTGTHGPEGNSKVEVNMVEAPPTGAPEVMPTLVATLDRSKHAPADVKQREEAIELVVKIAEEEEGKAEEGEKEGQGMEGVQENNLGNPDKWESLLGKGWKEEERHVKVERWLSFMASMVKDVKAVKAGRTGSDEWRMGKARRKNLEKKCLNIVRKIGQALSYIDTTEGEGGGG